MDEALSHYLRSLSDPGIPVSISDVEKLMKEYPFFTLPAVTLLRREGSALPADTRRRLMEQAALNTPDPSALAMLSDPDSPTWTGFYPSEKKNTVTTEDVIDTFLATYGHSSPKEDALLERLIFNPTADYSVLLSREEEESLPPEPAPADDSQDALINAFILRNRAPQPDAEAPAGSAAPVSADSTQPADNVAAPSGPQAESSSESSSEIVSEIVSETASETLPETPSAPVAPRPAAPAPADHPVAVAESADDTSLSESLAKIYIRRRRYDKAFEIIHNLSLKNPKKSVYFADQLRFLRKLMLNSSFNGQLASDSGSKE